jgi:DNA-binding CsgD family transcriptional regulator
MTFYRTFAYLTICGNLYTLLAFIGGYLTNSILKNQSVEASIKTKFNLILNFMGLPFLLLILFFLVAFFREIFSKPLTPGLKRASLVVALILAVLSSFVYVEYLGPEPPPWAQSLNMMLNLVASLIFLLGICQGFFYLREIKDLQHRKVLLIFTLLFITVYTGLGIVIFFLPGSCSEMIILLPWELILLTYMVKKMNLFYVFQTFSPGASKRLDNIYQKYNITIREQEIITLICRGKKNRDIEDALYISLQTVKNNIYNIYKKMKVKNRVELINFIRQQISPTSSERDE